MLFRSEPILSSLTTGRARGIVFAPRCAAEVSPSWSGNIEFTDCETQTRQVQLVTSDLLERYTSSYARHFSLWREAARKHAVAMAGVPAEPSFRDALHLEALPVGAVELCV